MRLYSLRKHILNDYPWARLKQLAAHGPVAQDTSEIGFLQNLDFSQEIHCIELSLSRVIYEFPYVKRLDKLYLKGAYPMQSFNTLQEGGSSLGYASQDNIFSGLRI